MALPARRTTYKEPTGAAFSEIDRVGQIRTVIRELERGQFGSPARFVDQMRRDDRVKGVSTTRINGLLGVQPEFRPARKNRLARKIADAAAEDWLQIFPTSSATKAQGWGLFLGFSYGQLIYDNTVGERLIPRIRTWHPQHASWDAQGEVFTVLTADGGTVKLPMPERQPHGDGSWFVYTPFGHEGWLDGLCRSLAIPFLIRNWAIRDWARFSERHGQPLLVGTVPQSGTPEDKDLFFDDLKQMAAEGVVVLPVGAEGNKYDLKLLEALARSHEGFDALMSKMEVSISVTVLGHNLTSEVNGASLAAANVGNLIRADYKQFDGATFYGFAREQVLYWWTVANFGEANAALTPIPVARTTGEGIDKAQADAMLVVAQAFKTFREAGVAVDVPTIATKFGLPLLADPVVEVDDEEDAQEPLADVPASEAA